MKLFDYLEELVVGDSVINDYIVPTLQNKTTFWVPIRDKYTKELQPKKLIGIHQIGINNIGKLKSIEGKRASISVFTNTPDVKKLLGQSIGNAGFGLFVIVKGTPLLRSQKDIKSRKEKRERWFNLGAFGVKEISTIKNEVIRKIKEHLGERDISSLSTKEKNSLISAYYKIVWETLKEKNPNDPRYYTHLSFGKLKDYFMSSNVKYDSNVSSDMKYNEVIMNRIKILKIYYDPKLSDKIDKNDSLFVPFDESEFNKELNRIKNQ